MSGEFGCMGGRRSFDDPSKRFSFDIKSEASIRDGRFIDIQSSIAGQAHQKIFDTEDQFIREGLIKLGWTPPADPSHAFLPTLGGGLRNLAIRLTPNPALSVEGTLAILLDGIERIDDEALARALGHISARQAGLDAPPLSDEQWAAADPQTKERLILTAQAFKIALRAMAG